MVSSIEENYEAFIMSQKIILENCITTFPLDIVSLIHRYNILLTTKSEYELFRKETKSNKSCVSIKDGKTFYDPDSNIYLIVYDDSKYKNRIRFTLAHELAHVLLGHLNDELTEIGRGGISQSLYAHLENEADTFAGNLLAPPVIIYSKFPERVFNISKVCNAFGLSNKAVLYYRKADFFYWLTIKHSIIEKIILNNFKNRAYPKYCPTCETQIFGKDFLYCPTCGEKLDNAKGDYFMLYDRIELNDRHKAKICPICNNEETDIDGEFCQICGTCIVNKCLDEDCGAMLPGSARFCMYCGTISTFGSKKFLSAWDNNENDIDDLPF